MSILATWKQKARQLKYQALTLYFAYRSPGVPWYARLFAALVVAYAFSPIDLIPDFIPVLGYLDDLVLIPLGVYLAIKMIPAPILATSRQQAQAHLDDPRPEFKIMAFVMICLWVLVAIWVAARIFAVGFHPSSFRLHP